MEDGELRGTFDWEYIDTIEAILDEPTLRLQSFCSLDETQPQSSSRVSRPGLISLSCTLALIIYGPRSMFEDIGAFFQDINMYLQDPKGCDIDVMYCNPHRLSSLNVEDCPMTSQLALQNTPMFEKTFQNVSRGPDALDILDTGQDLAEFPQPEAVLSTLKKYYKEYNYTSYP